MQKMSLQTTLRILSTPLYNTIKSAQNNTTKSLLYHHMRVLQKQYNINQTHLERRHPHIIKPWWKPPVVTIDDKPEDALKHHNNTCTTENTACIYTDGSGIDGHVGAAAVLLETPDSPNSLILQKRTYYMGRDNESTVYAAELKGILLALQILEATPDLHRKKTTVFTDNQSALKTLRKPGNTSRQYILKDILQLLQKVIFLGAEVDFRWIPAHRGIPGNKAADEAAKEVAGWTPDSIWTTRGNRNQNQDQEQEATEGVYTLITTAKRTINEALLDDWETIWVHGKHGRYLHSPDARPDKKVLRVHKGLPRAISSIMTQMRTGKIGLRAYLHKINQAETSQCTCNQGEQTVEHILLNCREWIAERQEL